MSENQNPYTGNGEHNPAADDRHTNQDWTHKPAYKRTLEDRYEAGKKLRDVCPRDSHATLVVNPDRLDPLEILVEQGKNRIQTLLPIRYGRMSVSPFTFYRGAAAVMAYDLSLTPTTEYMVQACGDCHLANFGAFGTAEGRILFDINDFDETYRAPWEWDLKRLAASFVIACQNNGFKDNSIKKIIGKLVKSYTKTHGKLAKLPYLNAWSSSLDYKAIIQKFSDKKLRRIAEKNLIKAESLTGTNEMVKMGHVIDDRPMIRDEPPFVYHSDDQLHPGFMDIAKHSVMKYKKSLPIERQLLMNHYELEDICMKVVGVGSVGTYCAVMLFFAGENDPLFLQLKEAQESVLAPYVPRQHFANHGERVVYGQRIMQSAGDVFLGHFISDASNRHYYVRKLHDVKAKVDVESFNEANMADFAKECGAALAMSHGRSGDSAVIAGYIGQSDEFAEAITAFSFAYSDLNRQDHQRLMDAIKNGDLPAMAVTE